MRTWHKMDEVSFAGSLVWTISRCNFLLFPGVACHVDGADQDPFTTAPLRLSQLCQLSLLRIHSAQATRLVNVSGSMSPVAAEHLFNEF